MPSKEITCADCATPWTHTKAVFKGPWPARCPACKIARDKAKKRDRDKVRVRDSTQWYRTPCSGGCGKLLSRGSSSSPSPVCHGCRKSGQYAGHLRVCGSCEIPFRHRNARAVYCSRLCYDAINRKWASPTERYRAKVRSRRARLAAVASELYSMADIVARDGILCSLCPAEVDMALAYPDPYCASVDHVIPVSKGGPDTLENVRLAHLRCNLLKSDKILE